MHPRANGDVPTPSTAPARLRVIVADGDPLARKVVKGVLQDAGVVVIAEAATAREAVELGLHYRPDVLVLEAALTDPGGLEAVRRLHADLPEGKVLVLTTSDDLELGLAALRAGADGFLQKTINPEALPRAVAALADGEAVLSRRLELELVRRLRLARARSDGLRPVRSPLTDREWQVLDLLARGSTTAQVGEELGLSTETVRSHVKRLVRKLGVSTRAEAVQHAAQLRDGLEPGRP